jgi:hypothetical protein
MLRKLKASLKKFMKTRSVKANDLNRVIEMVEDSSTKPWSEWTEEKASNTKSVDVLNHSVWVLKDLQNDSYWEFSELTNMYPALDVLESEDALKCIRKEFDSIHSEYQGTWKRNSIPQGKWELFPLINQGAVIEENAKLCPETMNLISELGDVVMHNCIYGNAMFSVIYPGSEIEPHCGPCNFRLRCHLPLYSSKGCRLTVGKQTTSWSDGEPLIFNDSYIHSVRHDAAVGKGDGESDSGEPGGCIPRVVLIVDLWHPGVTDLECEAIECLFCTNMLSQYFSTEH